MQKTPLIPLASFAQARWIDMAMNLAWLLDRDVGTHEQQAQLIALVHILRGQGIDWDAWFASNFTACAAVTGQCRHNVNNAMALKSAAVRGPCNIRRSLVILEGREDIPL